MDVSMIYSVAILHNCDEIIYALLSHTANFDATYEDINTLNRSKQQLQIPSATHISSSFQSTANRAAEYFNIFRILFQANLIECFGI